MCRAQAALSRLLAFGAAAAAVVQVADKYKGKLSHNYQSVMALLVIDFPYLEWGDGELVVKELAAADSHSYRILSYVFKRPTRGKKYHRLSPEWIRLLTTDIIAMMLV